MFSDDVLIVYDDGMLDHNPEGWDPAQPEWTETVKALLVEQYPDKDLDSYAHPERPLRLTAIVDRLRIAPIAGTRWLRPNPVESVQLERVHTASHVAFMETLQGRACWLARDTTAVSPGSVGAAKLAAGAGVSALDAIARGECNKAFCLVRPPGHHASAEHATGFCLYNNIAVAAAHARARLGWQRVLLWDWDLHHGNGTQAIFYQDPAILFVDTHCAAPFYPGTGTLEEIGDGAGRGFSINVPLPAGSGNAALLEVVDKIIQPAAQAFDPDLVLISAGFDPHYLDQIFAMDETGFAALTARMCRIADEFAQGRLVMMLEGGYNADALAESSYAVVKALGGADVDAVNVLDHDPGRIAVEQAVVFHQAGLRKLGA